MSVLAWWHRCRWSPAPFDSSSSARPASSVSCGAQARRYGLLLTLLFLPLLTGLPTETSAQTMPVISISSSTVIVVEGATVTLTLTASSAPTANLPVTQWHSVYLSDEGKIFFEL